MSFIWIKLLIYVLNLIIYFFFLFKITKVIKNLNYAKLINFFFFNSLILETNKNLFNITTIKQNGKLL